MSRATAPLLEVVIEKLVTGGLGLARHAGLTVMVPLTAPGDRARVRIVEQRATWARGELVELLEAGPGRRTPPCPHYARCGGCDLQHLDEDTQVALKLQAALETLARLGGVRLEQPPAVVRGAAWAYRRRAQLHVGAESEGDGSRGARIGHHARASHELVALERCPILVPALEQRLHDDAARLAISRATSSLPAGGQARLELAAGDGGSWTGRLDGAQSPGAALPGDPVEVRVGRFSYRFDASCFFQAHAGLLEELVEAALGPAHADSDGATRPAGEAADLYAGVGLFTLPLAARHTRVHAVESEPASVAFLAQNAERNGVTNLTLHAERVEDAAARLPRGLARVLIDPPRAGLSPAVRQALLALRPAQLTYVSCDIATLARDLRALAPAYALQELTLLDLFPQTSHLEAVAQLRQVAGGAGGTGGGGAGASSPKHRT